MAAGRIHVCSVGFSVALLFLVLYAQLIILKSMENDIASARRPVEGFEFAAWKFFKPSIYQPLATSGNKRFVPTRHRNFYSSSGFIIGLLMLCGDIISQPGPTITTRTQFGGPSVPLKGLVINARSMKSQHKVGTSRVSNLDRVQDLVCSEHADIVLISETWLNANILDQELFPLSDFTVFRKDRKDRNGGGVLIAAKANSFKSMREYVPDSENLKDLELVCAEMTTFCNKKVLFCSIYWPDPDDDTGCWLEKFNIFLDYASETYENMVIGGDLNLSKISWDSLENTTGTKEVAFLEILNDHFLTQLNFIPTRRDRVLDLVVTNVPDRVRVREVLSPKESDVFTDHGTVSFEFTPLLKLPIE